MVIAGAISYLYATRHVGGWHHPNSMAQKPSFFCRKQNDPSKHETAIDQLSHALAAILLTQPVQHIIRKGFQPLFMLSRQARYICNFSAEAMTLAEMASDCGLPPGVLNVVHGGHDTVNFLCDNETCRCELAT